MTRYLARCVRCDRAFWQPRRDEVTPEHTRWDRRAATRADLTGESHCEGSMQPGYWIGEDEGEGPLQGRSRR